MNLKIQGKVALVTGASKGIGLAIVYGLISEGVSVLLIARNKEVLDKVVFKLKEVGGDVEGMLGDVSQPDLADLAISFALKKWGRIDILVNNASGPPMGSFLEHSSIDWESAIQTNLLSVIRFTKAVSFVMRNNNWGRIVSISSTIAKEPSPAMVLSATTRAGLAAFSKAISTELAPFNITVNVICPGGVLTDRLNSLIKTRSERENKEISEILNESQESIPMKRFATPEEIANSVLFLVSESGGYITGVSLAVDGGLLKSY
jgi:3-oxoacyl-[acyl-carrier protein] reductase